MFGKLSVAFLIAASPALAEEPTPDQADGTTEAEAAPVAYKTKKVCRSIEVVGSAIPRTACTTKRIPIKPVVQESEADSEQVQHAEAPKGE